MRTGKGLLTAVALGLFASGAALAETLVRHDTGWRLGDIALATPHAHRMLVAVDGPGDAFRFDGNSNWLEAPGGVTLEPSVGVAAGAWLALAAPPGDTAAIVYLGKDGLLLGLNRWRQPEIRLGGLRIAGPDPLPVGQWVHVAGDYDGETLRLRVGGDVVAQADGDIGGPIHGLFAVGRALDAGFQQGTHPLGIINGVLGDVTFRRSADPVMPGVPPQMAPPLDVPDVWFANDPDRPRTLPLGAAGWTNEPHALIFRDGLWHLYHQANPNGAFWRDIVWGHQVSDDLAVWEQRHPALMPTTGFDRRGVWVGSWIPDRTPPAVLYTGVNGDWAGIGLAEADGDGTLRLSHVVDHHTPAEFHDMRDPWVVRTDDGWLMLIGTGARDRAEALVYSYRSDDGETWARAGLFDTGGVRAPGWYWELPMLLSMGDRWLLMGTPLRHGEPARTLYWLGTFDGTRFTPDSTVPRQFDILATYRAPTLARGPEGHLIAVGIVADEIRDEPARHASGWVHVLTPATVLDLCADDRGALCQRFAPAFAGRFTETLKAGKDTPQARLATDGQPVLFTASIDASDGGIFRLGMRVTDDGVPAAELVIDARGGSVRLDYTGGPVQPLGRPGVIAGRIPPSGTLVVEILIDGAAVFGTVNGRPLAFLAFALTSDRDALQFSTDDGARVTSFSLQGLARDNQPVGP